MQKFVLYNIQCLCASEENHRAVQRKVECYELIMKSYLPNDIHYSARIIVHQIAARYVSDRVALA